MPRYISTEGRTTLAIGICARCKCKYPLDDLSPDPNSPGLLCCPDGCLDDLDPWRLAPRPMDQISVEQSRPDVTLVATDTPVYVGPLQAVVGLPRNGVLAVKDGVLAVAPAASVIRVPSTWTPMTTYSVGAQVTPIVPFGLASAGLDVFVFTCIVPGKSGFMAPVWPDFVGVPIQDGQVTWVNAGIFLG